MQPTDPKAFRNKAVPTNFPIQVNEDDATVTVAAGIPQRMLLEYLSEYRYWKQPEGWTLPAFSWFIDQTIGGAISTGTHGSSMRWGSLSSQLRGMKVILANGTLLEMSPKQNLHLWRALGVAVGRLGAVTEVTLRIKPQQAVRRRLQELDFVDFAAQVKKVQDEYVAAKSAGDETAARKVLAQLDETNGLWHYALREVWRVDFEHLDKEPLSVLLNLNQDDPRVQAMAGPSAQGVFSQSNRQPVPPNNRVTTNPRFWANFYATSMRSFVTPGTFESSKSFLSFSEFGTRTTSAMAPYDQLEVAVPIEMAGDCLIEIGSEMYGPDALWEGFRTPALIRFVTGEDYYLSATQGGPRMYINIEDYITKSTKVRNAKFDRFVEILMTRCNSRLHWGKFGWEIFEKCYDGSASKNYPNTWCDFGCAVQELDPTGKFASESNVWKWNATRGGQPVSQFSTCCTPTGFNKAACQCASVNTC